jgi:hypothetical protein
VNEQMLQLLLVFSVYVIDFIIISWFFDKYYTAMRSEYILHIAGHFFDVKICHLWCLLR